MLEEMQSVCMSVCTNILCVYLEVREANTLALQFISLFLCNGLVAAGLLNQLPIFVPNFVSVCPQTQASTDFETESHHTLI